MEPTIEFVVIDVETTGLDSSTDEIIEIGALLYMPANHSGMRYRLESMQSLVKPRRNISPFITKLTGITNEMVQRDGRELGSVMEQFEDFIGGRRVVAYNAPFDLRFLRAAGMSLSGPVSCALKMAREAWPGVSSYKLEDIAKIMGLPAVGPSHRTLSDCQHAFFVYITAMRSLGRVE